MGGEDAAQGRLPRCVRMVRAKSGSTTGLKTTVITACFNRRDTIGDALASVRSQRGADIEHIVVDGGSTDGTLEVIERHRDSIARFIPGPDKGVYDALNKGIAA